jgi:endonuclease YncB( thermonuclease family)
MHGIARLLVALAFAGVVAGRPAASAEAGKTPPPSQRFAIPQSGVALVTGDAWIQNGQTMRLYGVQACIRGTAFTNAAGARGDCGEASLAYLAALIRDAKPDCAPLFQTGDPAVIYVVCAAHVGLSTLDLGAIMVTEGFAFASFAKDGDSEKPVYMPYMIAELSAKQAHAGLWASSSFTHPYAALSKAASGAAASGNQ